MTLTVPPDSSPRKLSYYLALEEFLASRYGEGFFLWKTAPCVIIGRNQDLETEVDTAWCRQNGVEIFRRRSGGGCVFSGPGNIMVSCIVPPGRVEDLFREYLERMVSVLGSLGCYAVASSHNDVMVCGAKVSGNAFMLTPAAAVIHGTLLFDADIEFMARAITPPVSKLEKHGVHSVRQRVANLKELYPVLEQSRLEKALEDAFGSGRRILSASEAALVDEIEKSYLSPSFILGKVSHKDYL